LAERFGGGKPEEKVFVYAAGGYYYPGKGLDELRREMEPYLDKGYTVLKMKIGAVPLAEDMRRIEAVLSLLEQRGVAWPAGSHLAVDANGRFDLATALTYARELAPPVIALFILMDQLRHRR
jgi:L-alanine-DL-glutamate epimerase-like enolase superfamily enzyme